MDREVILKKVIEVIVSCFYVEEDSIQEEDRLREDVGMDSLDKINFFMDIDIKFSITTPDEEVEKILTIKELIDYLTVKI